MAKKALSIVLAAIMLMSVLVVGSFAADSYEMQVKKLILGSVVGGTTLSTTKYNQYLQSDPNVLTENLQFWDDDIITAYNNATTEADWEDLYDLMTNDDAWVLAYGEQYEDDDFGEGYLVDYYPIHLQNGKAKTDVYYTADKEYIPVDADEAGRTITVQVAVSTNFWCGGCEVGIIYDKTLMDYVADSGQIVPMDGRKYLSTNADYGITSGKNRKEYIWPASMRENENGEYDQYGMVKISTFYDKTFDGTNATKFNKTPIATAQFVVKEGLPAGTELKFFSVDGTQPVIADFELQETWSATLFKTYRMLSNKIEAKPIECSEYDQTYTFYPATVTVGEPSEDLADYTYLDAAINDFDEANAADYKADLWDAYADAVDAGTKVARDLAADEQATVDNATAAITNAKAALVKNAVVSAAQKLTAVIGANAKVEITVDGNPEAVRLAAGDDDTLTFVRDDAFSIVENEDGTETWTVEVLASTSSKAYTATAKYANWTEEGKNVTVLATDGQDINVYAIYVEDMKWPEEEGTNIRNDGVISKGKHKVVVRTGKDVYKLQFVEGSVEDGCTSTYCPVEGEALHMAEVKEDGDQLVWTFDYSFAVYGEIEWPIRTRAINTTFATVEGAALKGYVMY